MTTAEKFGIGCFQFPYNHIELTKWLTLAMPIFLTRPSLSEDLSNLNYKTGVWK